MQSLQDTALYLSGKIEKMGPFKLISRGDSIPVFAFALKDSSRYSVFNLSDQLREHGWQVPAYTMPPRVEDLAVLRIVVREGFSRDLAEMFLTDLTKVVAHCETQSGHPPKESTPQFAH